MESARVTEHRREITNRLSMQGAKRELKLIRKLNKNDDLREHFIDQIQYFTDYKLDPEKAIKDKHKRFLARLKPIPNKKAQEMDPPELSLLMSGKTIGNAEVTEHEQEILDRIAKQGGERNAKMIRKLNKDNDLRKLFMDQLQYFTDCRMMDRDTAVEKAQKRFLAYLKPVPITEVNIETETNQEPEPP